MEPGPDLPASRHPGPPVQTWVDLTKVEGNLVSFRTTFAFDGDGAVLTSDSTLRFRSRAELADSLAEAGLVVDEVRDAPDRPGPRVRLHRPESGIARLAAGGYASARCDKQACVAKMVVSAEGAVDAPTETVYGYIADMREHHPRFLPPAFSDFQVESGGVGAGTVIRYKLTAGGRTREFRTTGGRARAGQDPHRVRHPLKQRHHLHRLPAGRRLARADLQRLERRGRDRAACSSACSRRGCCAPSSRTS